MKQLLLVLGLASFAAFAQEQPPADQGAQQPPPADQNAQQPPADQNAQQPPADQGNQQPAEQAAAPAEEGKPLNWYVGADYVSGDLSVSSLKGFAVQNYMVGQYQLRLGMRPLENIGVELHVGGNNSDGANDAKLERSYGLFLVPTATLFETVELAFPIGYNRSSVTEPTTGAKATLGSIAYGADLQLPLKVLWGKLPDVRLTAGGMVYYQKSDARIYAVNGGLRYDFTSGSFSGFHLPHWLWPF